MAFFFFLFQILKNQMALFLLNFVSNFLPPVKIAGSSKSGYHTQIIGLKILLLAKQRILILESDIVYRRSLFKALSKNDYNVFVAETFKEARDLCNQLPFDLVVIAVRHASEYGLQCLQQLRLLNPAAKVIILSTFARDDFEKKFAIRDFDAYLMKPVKRDVLLQVVGHTLQTFPLSKTTSQK